MKLNKQQAQFLRRLNAAHENAKDFSEGVARQERLDKYIDHLIEQGIDNQEILEVLY